MMGTHVGRVQADRLGLEVDAEEADVVEEPEGRVRPEALMYTGSRGVTGSQWGGQQGRGRGRGLYDMVDLDPNHQV